VGVSPLQLVNLHLYENFEKRGVVEKRGEEETKSMPHAPVAKWTNVAHVGERLTSVLMNYKAKVHSPVCM
jgi:hypothetical protein